MKTARTLIARRATLAIVAFVSSVARGDTVHFGAHDVTALFSISKSENKNQVAYAIHLDEHCAPMGDAPVFAFWRMYEKGAAVTEPLLSREEGAYGIAHERVLSAGASGGSVDLTLHAIPNRHITVRTQMQGGTCHAWLTVAISGDDAYLYNVHVKLKLLGVDYLLLSGWSADRSHIVQEKIER